VKKKEREREREEGDGGIRDQEEGAPRGEQFTHCTVCACACDGEIRALPCREAMMLSHDLAYPFQWELPVEIDDGLAMPGPLLG